MKIKRLWAFYVEENPSFEGDEDSIIKLTVRGFKKFFDETYRQAHTQGWNEGLLACKDEIERLKETNKELHQRLQQRDAAGKGGGIDDLLKEIFDV